MKFNDKVLAFIGRWLISVSMLPNNYKVDYGYQSMPQTLRVYKKPKNPNETMAQSIFAPSKEAYLDDDVLEKEVFDALNKLKEKVDREYVCKKVAKIVNRAKEFLKEDGYDTSMLNVKCNDTVNWVVIQATASDGPRKFKADRIVTYEEVLKFCDPVDALVTIMGDLIEKAEGKIGDDMEPAEAINIITDMLDSSQLLPWQKEALDVAVKTMTEKI